MLSTSNLHYHQHLYLSLTILWTTRVTT